MRLLAVTLGGALGSAARYLVQGWVQERASARAGWIALFPLGTLTVNLAGCFAVGLLATLLQERLLVAPEMRSFVLLGLLGGFTTFSSFGFETLALARAGNLPLAFVNVAASVGLGLVGVWLGGALGRLG
jgi:CrcB protein